MQPSMRHQHAYGWYGIRQNRLVIPDDGASPCYITLGISACSFPCTKNKLFDAEDQRLLLGDAGNVYMERCGVLDIIGLIIHRLYK